MNPLRAKMIEQMQLHRKAPGTQVQYVRAIADLTKYYWRAPDWRTPDQLSSQEIRHYLHYLLTERQLSWSSCNVVSAAIRFFYVDTLGWTPMQLNLPPRPAHKQLPRVLSVEQLEHLFATTDNPKHRVVYLQPADNSPALKRVALKGQIWPRPQRNGAQRGASCLISAERQYFHISLYFNG